MPHDFGFRVSALGFRVQKKAGKWCKDDSCYAAQTDSDLEFRVYGSVGLGFIRGVRSGVLWFFESLKGLSTGFTRTLSECRGSGLLTTV